MKKMMMIAVTAGVLLAACKNEPEHKAPPKKFYSETFDWNITIPRNFEVVSAIDWRKMQNKGKEALEKTTGEKIEINVKTLFVFRSDRMHYFEANCQPFDTLTDGPYSETNKMINQVLYQTFVEQMPGAKVDTATVTERVDGFDFNCFKMAVEMPDKKTMLHADQYSRLFDKKELTVSIVYTDSIRGAEMLQAFRASTFGKKAAEDLK